MTIVLPGNHPEGASGLAKRAERCAAYFQKAADDARQAHGEEKTKEDRERRDSPWWHFAWLDFLAPPFPGGGCPWVYPMWSEYEKHAREFTSLKNALEQDVTVQVEAWIYNCLQNDDKL